MWLNWQETNQFDPSLTFSSRYNILFCWCWTVFFLSVDVKEEDKEWALRTHSLVCWGHNEIALSALLKPHCFIPIRLRARSAFDGCVRFISCVLRHGRHCFPITSDFFSSFESRSPPFHVAGTQLEIISLLSCDQQLTQRVALITVPSWWKTKKGLNLFLPSELYFCLW